MHPTLERARKFQGLLELEQHDAPYSFQTIFNQDSRGARRLSKMKFKLLKRLDEKLRSLLHEGERVRYITSGCRASFLESYFLGWAIYFIGRRAIVVTDRRIVLLQIDSRLRPREMVAQIRYPAITAVKRTALGNTKLRLGDGKTHVFNQVPRQDRKFLQRLTEWTGRSLEPETAGMEDLCPHCYAPVKRRPPKCASCSGRFKSAARAGLLSLLFPGLGDLYLGHWKFAIVEIVVATFIWLSVLAVPASEPEVPLTLAGVLILVVFVVLFVHGADAIATWYIARKGVLPARG